MTEADAIRPVAAEDPYRPRATDHLVEPMFAGLGVGEDGAEDGEPARPSAAGGPGSLARRWLRWLTRLGRRG